MSKTRYQIFAARKASELTDQINRYVNENIHLDVIGIEVISHSVHVDGSGPMFTAMTKVFLRSPV